MAQQIECFTRIEGASKVPYLAPVVENAYPYLRKLFHWPYLMHLLSFKPLFSALALCAFAVSAQAPGDVRVALVIGNSSYASVPLLNPANDAKAMSETLRSIGFTVIEVRDGSKAQMAEAVGKIRDSLKGKKGVGMLYYAGHGLQMDARNFMVPVDAKLSKAADVPDQTVDVGSVITAFKTAGNRMNIVVLDACRDNPFGGITTGKGLAPLDAPSGTFLAYATAPGNVAADGDEKSGNGLYTQFLLRELKKPQARIEDVFKRVRFAVRQASHGKQIPWESTSLEDDFQFNDGRVVAQPRPEPQALQAAFSQELVEWERIKNSANADDLYAFIQKYPSGTIAEAAHARLNYIAASRLMVQGAGAGGQSQTYSLDKFRLGDVFERKFSHTLPNEVATVVGIENGIVHLQKKSTLNPGGTEELYDLQGGALGTVRGYVLTPPQYITPSGPLQPGKTWQIGYQARYLSKALADAIGELTTVGEGRVVARERITVAAGTFDAYRVEASDTTTGKDTKTITTRTYWVVPELPVPIKEENTLSTGLFSTTRISMELVRVQRAAGS